MTLQKPSTEPRRHLFVMDMETLDGSGYTSLHTTGNAADAAVAAKCDQWSVEPDDLRQYGVARLPIEGGNHAVIDLSHWTRMREVRNYADGHDISFDEAVMRLVNSGLSHDRQRWV